MSEKTENVSSFIVLEKDAGFPKWIAEYQRGAASSLVVAHAPGETHVEFVARVRRRLSERTGELHAAIVACSPAADASSLAVREELARLLLGHMGELGELVFAHGVESSEDSKHALFELAGAICEGLGGKRQVVRVRFSSGRPESGIMPSVAAAADSERRRVAALTELSG